MTSDLIGGGRPLMKHNAPRKKIIVGAIWITALLFFITAWFCRVTVEPGHDLVFNAKPMIFLWTGGVNSTPLREGSGFAAPTTSTIDVNMLPTTYDEEFKDIMAKDNNPVDYHAAVRLRIVDSVAMVKNFGTSWYKNNLQRPFQTMNRQELRQYSMPELALQQDVVLTVEQTLKRQLAEYAKAIRRKDGTPGGLPVEVQDVTLGRISPQPEIVSAYNETGVQQQRAKTEHQRALAEDARKEAETKRAQADRSYQDAMGLTAGQYIQLMQIKMCAEKQGGCTVILNGGATPVVSVK
jgi:regulator of protease activity HflC (stomatin/prohibitin superfamily)